MSLDVRKGRNMEAEHGCATTYDHDPVTSTIYHTYVQSVSHQVRRQHQQGPVSHHRVNVVEEPVCFANLKSSGEII